MGSKKLKLATFDTETDPFKLGRTPKPFAAGFYADGLYLETWGKNCIDEIMEQILDLPDSYLICAHAGGKFDFYFILPYLDNPIRIISSRIVKAKLGKHTVQDSYAIIPAPLKNTGQKTEIDYALFEADKRERPAVKKMIRQYLFDDCVALYNWVSRFFDEYGRQMTVGSTAMKQMRKIHDFMRMPAALDKKFRPFYYGGRVECIKPGIHHGDFKVFDVNSMYPTVMRDLRHPQNARFDRSHKLPTSTRKVFFATIEATSDGALPMREKEGISFPRGRHVFNAVSHEIHMASDHGLLKIHKVIDCHVAQGTTTFGNFVETFYEKRQMYKRHGDMFGEQFAKYILNSCYGKFGQDPENFKDWLISWEIGSNDPKKEGYTLYSSCEYFDLWSRPAEYTDDAYYDVSVAASITSGARSLLLDGLQHAANPLYCDTDSIICEHLDAEQSQSKLGAWKEEAKADLVCIAGKKLYALQSGGKWIKARSKGGSLTGDDIMKIAQGGSHFFESDRPTFSPTFRNKPIKRNFRKTT